MLTVKLPIFLAISIYLVTIITPCLANAPGQTQQENEIPRHKKIVEEVEVVNVEVPVRVFYKGKPVTNLNKSDFQLFVNGTKTEIHGFYKSRKTIDPAASAEPRLFVLMFNVCDYHLEMERALDRFFHLILRPHDRLMVITNHFFIDDTIILNPREEKEKLKKILQLEKGRAELKLKKLETELKSLIRSYKYRTERHDSFKKVNANDFINNYLQLVREFKSIYLNLATDKYIRLAQYLNAQKVERWVLGFYQIGWFYKPKYGSDFFKSILGEEQNAYELLDPFESLRIYDRIQEVLDANNSLPQDDLFKLFASTGATFHTLLLQHKENISNEFASDLTNVPVISDSYNLLKNLSIKTGGGISRPNDIDFFYQRILAAEDIHYVLTYVPEASTQKKVEKKKIKVTVNNKNYQVYYDDQKRGGYYQRILKKIRVKIPQIKIDTVTFKDQVLSFVVYDFKIPEANAGAMASDSPVSTVFVKLPVRIQVFNRKSESLFDGVQMFELTKTDAMKKRVKLQITFPKIPPGVYDLFVWVGDLLTGKRAMTVKEIHSQTP
jgi:hypothetical protein